MNPPTDLSTLTEADMNQIVSDLKDLGANVTRSHYLLNDRLLDKLEQRGLIARSRKPGDRRSVLVGITPAGAALLDAIAGPLRECHARQLGHLSRAELKTLTALLHAARAPHEPDGSAWA